MIDKIINIPLTKIIPATSDILAGQGIPPKAVLNERTTLLINDSISLYKETANPAGIIKDISIADFKTMYRGEGGNDSVTPLESIFPESLGLALFAVTVGEEISRKIRTLFSEDNFAPGSMLDTAASVGADMASGYMESYFKNYLVESGLFDNSKAVMRFSPGYCGWHVSGQRKLFEYLRPDKIGIKLTDSCLMEPLKSVSGVVVFGRKDIFEFDNNFLFCADCVDQSCLARQKSLMMNKT